MTSMSFIPSEVELAGVYMPPLLPAGILGLAAMMLTVYLLNRYRLSRFFFFPQLVMVALAAIYTVIFGIWVFPL
jgi:hypothetical protein